MVKFKSFKPIIFNFNKKITYLIFAKIILSLEKIKLSGEIMNKEDIKIENFDVIETVIDISEINKEYKIGTIEPLLIISINSKDLPWNYEQWDLKEINHSKYEIIFVFSHNNKEHKLIIDNNNYDENLENNLKKYQHVFFNISSEIKDDSLFYLKI